MHIPWNAEAHLLQSYSGRCLCSGPLHEIVRVYSQMPPMERMGVDRIRCTRMISLDHAPAADYLRPAQIRQLGDILAAGEA
jgi:hypothetical protein